MPDELREVDPRALLLPPSLSGGANREKLIRQFSAFGASTAGMPPPQVVELPDGRLVLRDGVTRATRIAEKAPGTPITVRVVGRIKPLPFDLPAVADRLR